LVFLLDLIVFAQEKRKRTQQKMSEQVEMEEDDKGTSLANSSNQSGEKKRFEVKKVFVYLFFKTAFK
jgi:hypothetical protein